MSMQLPEIIGLAGTNGAGKDTLGDLRFERQNARKVSLSDILRIEATSRGLTHERENLREISAEWGRKMGAGALSVMTLRNFEETRLDTETGISIVSVRRPAEAEIIQDEGGMVFWIDADREMRYDRIQAAARNRVDDVVSFEEFCAQEDIEMYPDSDDPFVVNMAGVRDIADVHVTNEFGTEKQYRAYLEDTYQL